MAPTPGVTGPFQVNGGIINAQTLTGGMRFFRITAAGNEFLWAVSDGTVNLPVSVSGGKVTATTYFEVGNNRPVPNSAAELVLQVVSQKADIVVIGFSPGLYGTTTIINIACSASAFGWGSDFPDYSTPPADTDEDQLPVSPTHAAIEMQAAINAIPISTVYITTGSANSANPPVSTSINFSGITVQEVSFNLGTLTYFNLA